MRRRAWAPLAPSGCFHPNFAVWVRGCRPPRLFRPVSVTAPQLPGWRYRPSEWRVAAAVRPFGAFVAPRRAFGPACVGGVGRCFGRCLMVRGGMGIDGTAALARSVRYSTAVIAVELLETASASWRQAARQPARAGGRRWRRRRRRAPCLRIVVLCDAAIFWCLWWHHAGLSLGSPVFRRRRAAVAIGGGGAM